MTQLTPHALLRKASLLAALLLATCLFAACEDEESALGIDLVDPATLYNGTSYTLYPDAAWSQPEDSLGTGNYHFCIIGNLDDPLFGKASSVLYTQLGLPQNSTSINFAEAVIDSVTLTLVKRQLFPDTAGTYDFHFEVKRLADTLSASVRYYSTDEIAADESTLYFDGIVRVSAADSLVRLRLDPSINSILSDSASSDEFVANARGLRIRILESSTNGMISFDLSSLQNCVTAHYHYINGSDTSFGTYPFPIGGGPVHFTRFTHNYSGTTFASTDSIGGANRLYLEALGGFTPHLSFDRDLKAFRQQHPLAVIHYAELTLPLAPETNPIAPERVVAMYPIVDDTLAYIPDLINLYTRDTTNGHYLLDNNHFRLHVTQHLQRLMRKGNDNGWTILLDARRNSALNSVIYGIADTATSPKIVFVYTE